MNPSESPSETNRPEFDRQIERWLQQGHQRLRLSEGARDAIRDSLLATVERSAECARSKRRHRYRMGLAVNLAASVSLVLASLPFATKRAADSPVVPKQSSETDSDLVDVVAISVNRIEVELPNPRSIKNIDGYIPVVLPSESDHIEIVQLLPVL